MQGCGSGGGGAVTRRGCHVCPGEQHGSCVPCCQTGRTAGAAGHADVRSSTSPLRRAFKAAWQARWEPMACGPCGTHRGVYGHGQIQDVVIQELHRHSVHLAAGAHEARACQRRLAVWHACCPATAAAAATTLAAHLACRGETDATRSCIRGRSMAPRHSAHLTGARLLGQQYRACRMRCFKRRKPRAPAEKTAARMPWCGLAPLSIAAPPELGKQHWAPSAHAAGRLPKRLRCLPRERSTSSPHARLTAQPAVRLAPQASGCAPNDRGAADCPAAPAPAPHPSPAGWCRR